MPAAPRLPLPQAAERSALEMAHLQLAGETREQWSPTSHRTATDPSTAAVDAVAHDVVHQALHAVSGALLTGDPRLLPETAAWIAELGRLLATTLRRFPLARDLVERHRGSGE